jgi:hypothetical protein
MRSTTLAVIVGRPSSFTLAPCPRKASLDPLDDNGALELGKDTHHLKHRLSDWRAGVDTLLVEVKIDALGMQLAEKCDQLLQSATEPVNGPSRHLIELAARDAPT